MAAATGCSQISASYSCSSSDDSEGYPSTFCPVVYSVSRTEFYGDIDDPDQDDEDGLYHALMEELEEVDDDLDNIHESLIETFPIQLSVAIMIAIQVIISLLLASTTELHRIVAGRGNLEIVKRSSLLSSRCPTTLIIVISRMQRVVSCM
jgi:hypothetical protein